MADPNVERLERERDEARQDCERLRLAIFNILSATSLKSAVAAVEAAVEVAAQTGRT